MLFVSLEAAGKQGRADTAKGGPWLSRWSLSATDWDAYCTGLHRQAFPGSGNRRQRRYAREVLEHERSIKLARGGSVTLLEQQ